MKLLNRSTRAPKDAVERPRVATQSAIRVAVTAIACLLIGGATPVAMSGSVAASAAPALTSSDSGFTVKKKRDPSGAAAAECTVANNLTSISCQIEDTKADDRSVFVEWELGDREERWDNNNGYGSSVPQSLGGLNRRGTEDDLIWRVCVNKKIRGDSCSDNVHVSTPPTQEEIDIQVRCAGFNTNNPPSASIPPDLQPQLRCYSRGDPPPQFSEWDKCMVGVAQSVAGISWEGKNVREHLTNGAKFTLKKVGPGVILTGWGVSTTIQECNWT